MVHRLGGCQLIDATLLTIHGFWSSPSTWDRLNAIWHADEKLSGLRIAPFGYPTPKKLRLPFSMTRVPDYDDIAQALATEYTIRLAEAPAIAIVTHSQGGLILQRFLAWMLQQGCSRELARIRSIVMLACPNGGSEYLRTIRRPLRFSRHPQVSSLEVLNRRVTDTQRIVLQRIVSAAGVDDQQCRIPFHVYAGASDNIVTAASAQGVFPHVAALAGDHSSILDPAAPGNRTAETVRYHLLADFAASPAQPVGQVGPAFSTAPAPDGAGTTVAAEKIKVNVSGCQGVIVGDHARIIQSFGVPPTLPGKPTTSREASGADKRD
jgi:pimeloyl-ACP methyl ester carboxylesterase